MKKCILFVLIAFISGSSAAQTAEDSVKAAVNKLFEAMKNSDAVLLQSAFGDSAVLQTIARTKDGKTIVTNESVAAFAQSIASAPKGSLDERIQFETIKIDGPMAIAWTPYSFYYNGKFSHCGVNSFQLVRFGNEWKIQYIIDTRRRAGCSN
ncbi:MAG: nuclear transport factor 2 family protein [Ferruginibacter sp.]